MSDFDARRYIREIARGPNGRRHLSRAQARELFTAIFAGDVGDLALGAALVAFRMKGETAQELAGMMDALAPHVASLRFPTRRALPAVIPTYNGARKLPNLVPLLALLLAREGVPVLLHGMAQEPQRISTFDVLARLGHASADSVAQAERQLEESSLAALALPALAPVLARLLDARLATGVRNCGHSIAKLLLPAGVPPHAAFRLIAVTHPDFQALMREHFAAHPGHVLLLRGVEGEPVLRLHAPQPVEQIDAAGTLVTRLMRECEPPAELPERDADATAQWTRSVLDGRIAVPAAIAQQVELIAGQCREANAHRPPLTLVSSQ